MNTEKKIESFNILSTSFQRSKWLNLNKLKLISKKYNHEKKSTHEKIYVLKIYLKVVTLFKRDVSIFYLK